jgi:nucleotide-binding universal stress UspA family protein
MKVLIATDGSKSSKLAVDWVTENSWNAGAEFLVVSVAESPYLDRALEPLPEDISERITQNLETIVAGDSACIKKRLPANAVSCRVVYGRAQNRIAETAREWGADLIVIGSHERKGINRFLLGSVAEAVLHLAPCSVLIVKNRSKDTEAFKKSATAELAPRVKDSHYRQG